MGGAAVVTLARPIKSPILRALHTAGSFLGDFPTPYGFRDFSPGTDWQVWAIEMQKWTFAAAKRLHRSQPSSHKLEHALDAQSAARRLDFISARSTPACLPPRADLLPVI